MRSMLPSVHRERADDAMRTRGSTPRRGAAVDPAARSVPFAAMPPPAATRDPRIAWRSAADIRAASSSTSRSAVTRVPSSSLVPAGDNTLLFVNSGMVPFKDALTGAEKRSYTRAVNFQRCLRVAGKHNDFEEVGRSPRHHTLFEMLGNWSFGDYFKREAIHWAWDFLTKDLGIPGERLAATVYTTDDVAHAVWKDEIGLPPERLVRWGDFPNGDEKNWWRMADTGPCGPCSEIHFDRGAQYSEGDVLRPGPLRALPALARDLEPRVHGVRAQHPDRSLTPLPRRASTRAWASSGSRASSSRSARTTTRTCSPPIHERMRELFGHDPDAFEAERFSYQVIADHSRAITFLIGDGVLPSNEGRGYVCRRIIRRAVRHGRLLGRKEPFLAEAAKVVIDTMGDAFPYLREQRGLDPRRDHPRGGPVRADARRGHGPARGGADPADLERSRDRPQGRRPARRRAGPARRRSRSSSTTRSASRST